ncbi:ABC transporter substrate-binding protein [Amorphus sp. 3PC139-8]|uniref:ABC transporter substrate-binding protein n=1 Tax=Amorphus sp. 3PC139-8 TaxID=2735676 RepID=UPI00345DD027
MTCLRAAAVAVFSFVLAPLAALAGPVVTDLAGRTVELPDDIDKVVLGEGRFLPVLAILETENPVDRIAGMMGEYERLDPDGYALYEERFPALADVPRLGLTTEDSFSLEKAISLGADVAIFGVEGHGPSARAAETIAALEAAGVTVVFVDFRQKPLENTGPSIELLGTVLGREERAREFLDFYETELRRVTEPLANAQADRPLVFVDSRVGLAEACCETMGDGMIGEMVAVAGGANMGAEILPGLFGTVSLEYLLTNQPDIYVGTGIGTSRTFNSDSNRIALGAGISVEQALRSLDHSLGRVGIADLRAVEGGRAHAIWHHFYNTPFHVAAIQEMATWFHPDLFADLDPEATLSTLYERYQPVPLDGTYWVSQ